MVYLMYLDIIVTKDLAHIFQSCFFSCICIFMHLKMNKTQKRLYHTDFIHTDSYSLKLLKITGKGFTTLYTSMGFLSLVGSFMPLKITVLYKAPTTLIIFKEFLSMVGSSLSFKVTVSYKCLTTLITSIGFLFNMCTFMSLKLILCYKGLPTLNKFKEFLFRVRFCMPFKIMVSCKGLTTLIKFICFFSSMCSSMELKTTGL